MVLLPSVREGALGIVDDPASARVVVWSARLPWAYRAGATRRSDRPHHSARGGTRVGDPVGSLVRESSV